MLALSGFGLGQIAVADLLGGARLLGAETSKSDVPIYGDLRARKTLREIYKGIRKPVPPPTRVEPDRREKIKRREDRKEMDRHRGRGKHRD